MNTVRVKCKVVKAFQDYLTAFDMTNPKILLKVNHTYHVAMNCETIARDLGLSDEQILLTWVAGMLHDIGRFEQVAFYNTWLNHKSVDHAELGADVLFGKQQWIKKFLDDRSYDELLETAIRMHNKYALPADLPEYIAKFCSILRDADKIDIIRVNTSESFEETVNAPWEKLLESPVSPEVMKNISEGKLVDYTTLQTPADMLMAYSVYPYDFIYDISWRLVKEQGYLDKLLDIPYKHPTARQAVQTIKEHLSELEGQRLR